MKSSEPGTWLVVGRAGFLGSYVAREAERHGHRVVSLDGMRLPCAEARDAVARSKPHVVVHAAGPASVAASLTDPAADLRGSVDATACMLDAVRLEAPKARFVYVSSAAVYGNAVTLPIPETAPCAPLSPYGYHRLACELLVEEHARLFGLATSSARVFSAYGAGLRRQVVFDLVARAWGGGELAMDGTGDESRDFVHVRDIASALVRIATAAPGIGERVNVACGVETRMHELASIVARECGAPAPRFSGRVRAGDPLRWQADVSALRGLGWSPEVRLDAGIREVFAWYGEERRR